MMFNLLRSDLYRLIHGRKFWIVTALSVLLTAGLLTTLILLGAATGAAQTDTDGVSVTANATAGLAATARMMDSHTAMLASSGMGGGSILAMCVAVLAVLAVMDDWDTGFVKNLVAGRRSRTPYVASRLLLSFLLTAWNAIVAIVALELSCLALGVRFRHTESIGAYLGFCGLKILGTTTFVLIAVALAMIVRSKAFGVAVAVLVGAGVIGSLTNIVLSMIAAYMPWLGQLTPWLPSNNVKLYADSAGLFATTAGGVSLGIPVWAHALICFAGWIVLSAGAALLVNRRRDVC
ncbi:ABC transporter permease [Bifidobacterium biavatii]|uniref:Ribose/xylose/arabinose/galactoside ABC transporter, permease n=1 Tax=Bifidobacterium biavatii DSM 23969 TaxID=1437608 RepID=A0A087A1W5_9BIFI|nr:ABC transporter permease [Bifidobacterium biavatii]KFI52765.1 ribose/xylose/arabinose/galactoside ABC transporter, permease [Bifidobacterium biavatii DSM 23969]